MIRATIGILAGQGGIDADAQAFFDRVDTAGGTLSTTEQDAILTLVADLKADGIWTKMKAIYPMVGASAAACAQNLKSSSFTGSFTSGWTFASTGATPNGTSAYMDTGLQVSSNLSLNSTHISSYIRTNNSSNQVAIGASRTGDLLNLFPNFSGSSFFRVNSTGDSGFSTGGSHLGCWIANRISSSETRNYKNSTRYINATTSTAMTTNNVWLAAVSDATGYYANEFAFASIGDGLTDTEAGNFYTAVQAFQTTLSRNV